MSKCTTLLIMCCLAFLFVTSACSNSADQIAANQDKAERIILALDDYEHDYGQFPENLEALVPGYLTEIPETTSGQSFVYRLDSDEGYFLIFSVPGEQNLACRYIHRWELWDCSYGDSH